MKLEGSKTEEMLQRAFVKELQAAAEYRYFASAAAEAGLEHMAELFLETSANEAEHAERHYRFIRETGGVSDNLQAAMHREHEEARAFYPEAAKVAEKEEFHEIAECFRRMISVEEKHKRRFREALKLLEIRGTTEGRTVRHSALDLAQLMLPQQANLAGFVHGGELMKLMDNAAGVVAIRHSHATVVTALVDELRFLHPVKIGDLVLIHAKITFVSRTSMEVRVEVKAESLFDEKKTSAVTAYFIMVALDDQGKPKQVPPLIVSTEEEERLFNEALLRYRGRKLAAND